MTLTLVFRLAGRDYGLEIDAVQEIIESPPIHSIPRGGTVLKGVLNVRGEVLPVVDLPSLLNFADGRRDERMIVLAREYRSLALQVGRIEGIVPLDLGHCAEAPADAAELCIRAVVERETAGPVHLLQTDAVFERLERIF